MEYLTAKKKRTTKGGFTLIELLVSVFIFAIVMTISIGTLIVLIGANEKSQGIQSAMTNLSFAVDSMTRSIRTGNSYYCIDAGGNETTAFDTNNFKAVHDCSFGGNTEGIVFVDGETGHRMGYRHEDPGGGEPMRIERRTLESNGTDTGWVSITSSDVSVEVFIVEVTGTGDLFDDASNNAAQPQVSILITGDITSDDDDAGTDFELQTTITQRRLDF